MSSQDTEEGRALLKDDASGAKRFGPVSLAICFLVGCGVASAVAAAVLLGGGAHADVSEAPSSTGFALSGGARAIAIAGGGFRALSVAVGTTTSLLGALAANGGGPSLDTLFGNIPLVSSNSGGSWFSSELLYSQSFNDLLVNMSKDLDQAGVMFNNTWINSVLRHTSASGKGASTNLPCAYLLAQAMSTAAQFVEDKVDAESLEIKVCERVTGMSKIACRGAVAVSQPIINKAKEAAISDVEKIVKEVFPWQQDLWQFMYVSETQANHNWESKVSAMLSDTAGISGGLSLGSDPVAWAKGKAWQACTSIPTPADGGRESFYYYSSSIGFEGTNLSYNVAGASRDYVPARFSVVLGSGVGSTSPFSFCATEDCFGLEVSVHGGTSVGDAAVSVESSSSAPATQIYGQAIAQSGGRLAVDSVASASSSALGASALTPGTAAIAGVQCGSMATWISNVGGGRTFDIASLYRANTAALGQVSQAMADSYAYSQVQGLVDGAYTDNTGIAWAIASGATEVVCIMNSESLMSGIFYLFAGAPAQWGAGFIKLLYYNIFEESEASAKDQYQDFPRLEQPGGTSKFVKGIAYGTWETTTVENKWFGIKAGIKVTLHVLSVEAVGVSMADLTDFYYYGTLVNEITSTFAYAPNKDAVNEILCKFYGVDGAC
eukprot:TRINITY_DN34141_c0_g1_i1.p1 TRINITY_DN34141_c0_g1~~TRINITY_DN34141_c0_g1_i1.p1  ORF type:complete len:684 (-),score=59.55 TRINITY_DN34141_c0_g1_i1:171-2159(-)